MKKYFHSRVPNTLMYNLGYLVVGEWRKKRETPKSPLYPHLLNESHPSDPIYESVRLKVGPKVPTSYERPK